MTGPELHFVVPGPLDQRTGGYIYDKRMVEGLRRRDWTVVVHSLDGEFLIVDARARASLAETLLGIPDGAQVVIDGLAMRGMPGVVRAHRTRIRLVALVHLLSADDPALDPSQRDRTTKLEREALTAGIGIIVTSPFAAARLNDMGVDPAAIRTVPPGTDPAPPATGPGPADPPQLLCVASVTPGKGQDVLVRALSRLADTPWSCVCAGSLTRAPAFTQRVVTQVREAGLSDRIAFPGECDRDTTDLLYMRSSIFILPSHYESFGMVLTEAMARGLPIISTTGGAIPRPYPSTLASWSHPGMTPPWPTL